MGKGIVLRTKAGAPGIGEIKSFPDEEIIIATKTLVKLTLHLLFRIQNIKK